MIVTRGLGRNGVAAALLVTAGLGLVGVGDVVESAGAPTLRGPDPRARTDFTDDEMIDLAIAIVVSGCLDG